jgi:hypothetical protein
VEPVLILSSAGADACRKGGNPHQSTRPEQSIHRRLQGTEPQIRLKSSRKRFDSEDESNKHSLNTLSQLHSHDDETWFDTAKQVSCEFAAIHQPSVGARLHLPTRIGNGKSASIRRFARTNIRCCQQPRSLADPAVEEAGGLSESLAGPRTASRYCRFQTAAPAPEGAGLTGREGSNRGQGISLGWPTE